MTPDKPRSQKKAGSVARVGGSRKHFAQKPQGRSGPVTRTFDESGAMPVARFLSLVREYKDMP